jgi:hypothetical protein
MNFSTAARVASFSRPLQIGDLVHPLGEDGSRILTGPVRIEGFEDQALGLLSVKLSVDGVQKFWPADQIEFAGTADKSTHQENGSRCWRLPNAAARDVELAPDGLVLLAYRITVADSRSSWGLHAGTLREICVGHGSGNGSCQKAIANIRNQGYLDRHTRKANRVRDGKSVEVTIGGNKRDADGRWLKMKDRLTGKALDCGVSGNASRHICRKWFHGQLTVKEMATFLYLRAGAGPRKGPVMVKDLKDRFGWSERTALKVLNQLREKGLVEKRQHRTKSGQMARTSYSAVDVDEQLVPKVAAHGDFDQATSRKKPSNGLPSNGETLNTRRLFLHALPLEELPSRTAIRRNSRFRSENACNFEELRDEAWCNNSLLGWMTSDEAITRDVEDGDFDGRLAEMWDEFAEALPDQTLLVMVKEATAGKVHRDILSPAGLCAIRWLSLVRAFTYSEICSDEDLEIGEVVSGAHDLMKDLSANIRDKDRYLNSLRLVGERLLGCVFTGVGIERQGMYSPRFKVGEMVRLVDDDGKPYDWPAVKIDQITNIKHERHVVFKNPETGAMAAFPARLCDRVGDEPSISKVAVSHKRCGSDKPLLSELQSFDRGLGRVLSPKLFHYPALRGFNALVAEFGTERVANATREACREQGAINGKPVGSIVSWGYIRTVIEGHIRNEREQGDNRRPT